MRAFRIAFVLLLSGWALFSHAATLSLKPVAFSGFDIQADGKLLAPIRLAANHALLADRVEGTETSIRLSAIHCRDTNAVRFAPDDYVSIQMSAPDTNGVADLRVQFRLSLLSFDAKKWQALFPGAPAPFHFLVCSMPSATVWHQRGWLNATPKADPFPLLLDNHVSSPEISSLWNRNWSYLCPVGGHPIPLIGLWDPEAQLYIGYDFTETRATDQSARYLATGYCWQEGTTENFIALAYPHGGLRYGQLVYPQGGEVLESHFHLVIDPHLSSTDDPNERYQARLFANDSNALPSVPDRSDLSWIPGSARLSDFMGPIGLDVWGGGGETTFYPSGTLLINGWTGHREMPVDTALRRNDTTGLTLARTRIDALLKDFGRWTNVAGDACLFFEKPLAGSWRPEWGGPAVTSLHNSDGWYAARVLVELYRYDQQRGMARASDLRAIDGLLNWAKHFVWSRNEFADVPSSPFAIGSTLSTAFLLDYYFTFVGDPDPVRRASADGALTLARNLTWRYLQVWAMDSDRIDDAIDGSFLAEPNSGRDWAGLGCANEVNWNIDALTQVYVHTGDPRMRYYLRGMLQRWPLLYRPIYEDSLAQYGSDSLTEGFGLFDGSGPGRGGRYSYGFTEPLPLNEPVGNSRVRVVAGARACIAFCKGGAHSDATDYCTSGRGACSFRLVSDLTNNFDVSFSYPCVDISALPVRVLRDGQQLTLGSDRVRRPLQSPSSLYLSGLRNGDVVEIGDLPAGSPVLPLAMAGLDPNAFGLPRIRGDFELLSIPGDTVLNQSWDDPHSFAGIIPGERWAYGVPYQQTTNAAAASRGLDAQGANAVFVAYAPPSDAVLTKRPSLTLDDGTSLALNGQPIPAWRGWPPMFLNFVLLDYALIPAGRSAVRIEPGGTLLMGATAYRGTPGGLAHATNAFAAAAKAFQNEIQARDRLLALRQTFASLPTGRLAILPGAKSGAGANFCRMTGLQDKAVQLTSAQLIDTNQFNAARFPFAFYLNDEHYVKTVVQSGDGKAAVTRYLAAGGTIVLLSTGPFPFYYGDGPNGQAGLADPLLPPLGLPIGIGFEQPPVPLQMHVVPGQSIVHSLPPVFPLPSGDPRLRAVDRSQVSAAQRYTPLIEVQDGQGHSYGDAAAYIQFGTGPARGGRVLYLWSTLLSSDQGDALMADTLSWLIPQVVQP